MGALRFDLVTYRENSLVGSGGWEVGGEGGWGRALAWALGCAAPCEGEHPALSHTHSSARPPFQSAHSKNLISTLLVQKPVGWSSQDPIRLPGHCGLLMQRAALGVLADQCWAPLGS